jgi:hypothetical protein
MSPTAVTTAPASPRTASAEHDWRGEHDRIRAEMRAAGLIERVCDGAAYWATVAIIMRGAGCDAYEAAAQLTRAGVPLRGPNPWGAMRGRDAFAPGDGARAGRSSSPSVATPPTPKARWSNAKQFIGAARTEDVEHLRTLWLRHHGVAEVAAESVNAAIVAFIAGEQEEAPAVGDIARALAWHLPGHGDGEGRYFAGWDKPAFDQPPSRFAFRFPPLPVREPPTNEALTPIAEAMTARVVALLDDEEFRHGLPRRQRVLEAQRAAYAEAIASYAAAQGVGEQEAARRFERGGLYP